MNQKLDPNRLPENPTPSEDNVFSESQKMASKEAPESSNISNHNDQLKNAEKEGEIDNAKKIIGQNMEGDQNIYSYSGSASNPDALVQGVLKQSYMDSNEDLKEYAGKIKPKAEVDHANKNTQMTSVQFEDANQKGTQFINMIRNILEKIGKQRMGAVGNMKDGNGKKVILAVLLIIGLGGLAIAAVFGMRNARSSTEISQGANQPENNPLELVLVTPSPPVCSIKFKKPASTSDMPNFGPVLFEWNSVAAADSYSLEVAPPADTSLPWIYSVTENSKKVYMENFPMGGTFLVSVKALSGSKEILCSATFRFDKEAFVTADQENKNNNDNNEKENNNQAGSAPCVTTGMAYICP